ncbi:MAG: aspartate/glutamate racemase family protein [Deltaproteobacteria bacterium]|nr:aspartate/glutamate racemase family protein [Deltaproteobacteria bacterium]
MIGVFDSGLGGLTVLRALSSRFPQQAFLYLGDHANAPYGDRASAEIVAFTQAGVARLFALGAKLVVLGCNTATAVALRTLQRKWLPGSGYAGRNVVGIVAPTVEAATQTPWAVTTPQYPQKNNRDVIAVFGTTRTIASGVYAEEIFKRCPRVRIVLQPCSELAAAIENAQPRAELEAIVANAVKAMTAQLGGGKPDRAILGCTHFSLVEDVFAAKLPAGVRILSQPEVVADSFEDYLARHPEYAANGAPGVRLLTTGDPAHVSRTAAVFWPEAPRFERAAP